MVAWSTWSVSTGLFSVITKRVCCVLIRLKEKFLLTRAIETSGDGIEEGVLGREQPLAHGHPPAPRTPRSPPST